MRKKAFFMPLLMLLVWGPSLVGFGDRLDEAKERLAAKKYDQVDEILQDELAKPAPAAAALKISLAAALKSGRYVTAQKRITKLLQVTRNQEPELIFQGAEIAAKSGNDRLAMTRYLMYTRFLGEEKNPKLAQALRYLLRHGVHLEECKRYIRLYGSTEEGWQLGIGQLSRLFDLVEGGKGLELAGFLLKHYPSPPKAEHIAWRLRRASDDFQLGKSGEMRLKRPFLTLLENKAKGVSQGYFNHFYDHSERYFSQQERVKNFFKIQELMNRPIHGWFFYRFDRMRGLKSEAARLEAGKKFLGWEAKYKEPDNPDYYYQFTRLVTDSPQVFHIKDKELVSDDKILEMFDLLKAKYEAAKRRGDYPHLFHHIQHNYLRDDKARRIVFLRQNLAILDASRLRELMDLTEGKEFDQLYAEYVKDRCYRDKLATDFELLGWYSRRKQKDKLLQTVREHLAAFPGSFNHHHVYHQFFRNSLFSLDERLAVLEELLVKGGRSNRLQEILNWLNRDQNFQKHEKFKKLQELAQENQPGTDPQLAAQVAMHSLPARRHTTDPKVTEAVKSFLADYAGQVPGGWNQAKNPAELRAYDIFERHGYSHSWDNRKAITEWAELWAPRLGPGGGWESFIRRAREHGLHSVLLQKVLPHFSALVKQGAKFDRQVWWRWTEVQNPRGVMKSALWEHFDQMGPELALNYVFNQRHHMHEYRKKFINSMASVAAKGGYQFHDRRQVRDMINHIHHWTNHDSPMPPSFTRKLWEYYLAKENQDKRYDPYIESNVYAHYVRSRHSKAAAAWLKGYFSAIRQRDPTERYNAIQNLIHHVGLPREKDNQLKPGHLYHSILNLLKPLYLEEFTQDQRRALWIAANVYGSLDHILRHWRHGQERQQAYDLARSQVDMLLEGVRFEGHYHAIYGLLDYFLREAVRTRDWDRAARLLAFHATLYRHENWHDIYRRRIKPTTDFLTNSGAHELTFVYLTSVFQKHRPPEEYANKLMVIKSKAAQQIPGLIAVAKGHPAYNLHLAAHAYSLGNESRAWELTSAKLKLLPKSWASLDPNYVAWALDQMRKQKMLKEALAFAFTILVREKELDPEVAATVSLIKGDIYRDRENFQAARIEYESLAANRRYRQTAAGAVAKFHLIALLIQTKDHSAAENYLERLVNSNKVQTQAEAYYFYARMAFDQADYQLSRDNLTEVFKRTHDHVNARLLEGELKLKLPRGLADTEVAVGNPKLSTIAIPGRVLTLKLQDANLSVARGGAAIPVVVRTSAGGDVENVKLLPSGNDRTLFVGAIATALGTVIPNNLQLELRGDDVVSYVIDPQFQKANDINYPPKELEVKANAYLMVSAGEILSRDELEKRELEERLRRASGEIESARFRGRSGYTVRPGSPIFVQVIDFDRDFGDQPDQVKVDLQTSSGDLLKDFILTETEPHSGIFRGKVITGIPAPRALASDTEEGKIPSSMINLSKPGVWRSLADGKAPKWVEVDTMSSYQVKASELVMQETQAMKRLTLLGLLDEEYEKLADFPARVGEEKGGLRVLVAPNQRGHEARSIRHYVRMRADKSYHQTKTSFDRTDTPYKGRDGWMSNQIKGAFYLSKNRLLELRFLQEPSRHGWQHAYLFIDGTYVLGGHLHNLGTLKRSKRVPLIKGVHRLEVLVRDHCRHSKVIVGYRTDAGTFEALPARWFSVEKNPRLADALKSRGKIERTAGGFKAELTEAVRLRRLRWVFEEFTSNAVSVKEIRVTGAKGERLIPVREDFTAGKANRILEISPGDEIVVSYMDERRLDTHKPQLSRKLSSSFYNGEIFLANEEILEDERRGHKWRWIHYEPAKRCRAGDQLMVFVNEYDEDLTEERDTVTVTIKTSSGEVLQLKALETNPNYPRYNHHSGVFLAVLRFGAQTQGNMIKVKAGDQITVSYLDKENTRPGIPVERSYTLYEAGLGKPEVLMYQTTVNLIKDTSREAHAKLKRLRRQGHKGTELVIYKEQIIATHPEYEDKKSEPRTQNIEQETQNEEGVGVKPEIREVVSVGAPLLFEVYYPRMALHRGSVLKVTAASEAELAAAAREGREPDLLEAPLHVRGLERLARDKGYSIRLRSHVRRDAKGMLEEGIFAGVIRLQIGSHGDPVDDLVVAEEKEFASRYATKSAHSAWDDYRYRVPTLLVSGSDIVQIRVKNIKTGEEHCTRVRLLSDARLELLDSSYTYQKPAVHLGERFQLKLTDPDHDISNKRDRVKVKVRSGSGDGLELVLEETIGHSGIFTGVLRPEFIGEEAQERKVEAKRGKVADPKRGRGRVSPKEKPQVDQTDEVLAVNFGDEVTFEYVDDSPLQSLTPVKVVVKGRIYFGADAELASFTKKFKDSEVAVKTRFLTAEALFEMAKDHRKLKQVELAREEIARGKRILEEALRDYPDTSLAAQGEFLLGNLDQELGNFQKAIGRYANVIGSWPDSEYAARSQFKKAICLEKLKNYKQACEEYVKLTYLYPESSLVADATVRLGNYFYRNKKFKTAGRIFYKFALRAPHHRLAVKALFLGGQCHMRQQDYKESVRLLKMVGFSGYQRNVLRFQK